MGKVIVSACGATIKENDELLELIGKPVKIKIGNLSLNKKELKNKSDKSDDMIV
ncbi:MAG: hypothetical protein RSB67_03095 [Clostridia bacterium]